MIATLFTTMYFQTIIAAPEIKPPNNWDIMLQESTERRRKNELKQNFVRYSTFDFFIIE